MLLVEDGLGLHDILDEAAVRGVSSGACLTDARMRQPSVADLDFRHILSILAVDDAHLSPERV